MSQLHLRAGPQGQATGAVVFATLTDRGGPCLLSAPIRLTIYQHGKLARGVRGNPVAVSLSGARESRARTVTPEFRWDNWCGATHALTGVVIYRQFVKRFRFLVLPACVNAGDPSSVAAYPRPYTA